MTNFEAYTDEIHDLTERVDRVLRYIEKNPNSDPNAYEMMELTADIGVIQTRVRSVDDDPINNQNIEQQHQALNILRNKYSKMMDIRLEQIKCDSNHLGTDESSPLYTLLSTKYKNVIAYGEGQTGIEKEMSCKLAGMGLYQKQRKRDFGEYDKVYDKYEQIEKLEWYYCDRKPIPEAEKQMLSELLCIFVEKVYVDNMLSDNPRPVSEINAQMGKFSTVENTTSTTDKQELTFAQKIAQKIADNKFLSKLPFMNKFIQKHITMISDAENTEKNIGITPKNNIQQDLTALNIKDEDINIDEFRTKPNHYKNISNDKDEIQ